jgi:hypothetical protein
MFISAKISQLLFCIKHALKNNFTRIGFLFAKLLFFYNNGTPTELKCALDVSKNILQHTLMLLATLINLMAKKRYRLMVKTRPSII